MSVGQTKCFRRTSLQKRKSPEKSGLFRNSIRSGLHRGDFGEVKFTTLCSSTYPYFAAVWQTFKLHNSTYPFTQPVSIDVTCDVSDVNSMFLMYPQYSIPPCGLQGVMLLRRNCPVLQTLTFSVPWSHRHRCSGWWRYPHGPGCPASP